MNPTKLETLLKTLTQKVDNITLELQMLREQVTNRTVKEEDEENEEVEIKPDKNRLSQAKSRLSEVKPSRDSMETRKRRTFPSAFRKPLT
jgi:hypothetical protein